MIRDFRLRLRLPRGRWRSMNADLFETEEAEEVERRARLADGVVYSWKTSGRQNWLEHAWSIADVLGLVVLPRGLPETIDLPDDPV